MKDRNVSATWQVSSHRKSQRRLFPDWHLVGSMEMNQGSEPTSGSDRSNRQVLTKETTKKCTEIKHKWNGINW